VADAGVFLARLTRIDPQALVRLRAAAGGRTALWARLPWSVLVTRTVVGAGPDDATVSAAALLTALNAGDGELPSRRDPEWRVPLPPSAGRVVEALPVTDVRRLATAAAGTVRAAATHGVRGRAVGQRLLRDALLDHVAVVVTGTPAADHGCARVEVPQRLVQAVARMGFLGTIAGAGAGAGDGADNKRESGDIVQVRLVGPWVGLSAPYGVAWWRSVDNLTLSPGRTHTNG